jgi:hypothetical protein
MLPTLPAASVIAATTGSPEQTATTSVLRRYETIRTVVDDLPLQTTPGTTAVLPDIGRLIDRGAVAIVIDGPASSTGSDWYRVLILHSERQLPELGWIAVQVGGRPTIVDDHPACAPAPVDFFEADTQVHALECLADEQLTFKARLGGDAIGPCMETQPAWSTEPSWLDICSRFFVLLPPSNDLDGPNAGSGAVGIAMSPGVDASALSPDFSIRSNWPLVQVTGRYDDPVAGTCHSVANPNPDNPAPRPDQAIVEYDCRNTFVVTSLELLPR